MKKFFIGMMAMMLLGTTAAEARGFRHHRRETFRSYRRPCHRRVFHETVRYYEHKVRYYESGYKYNDDPYFSLSFDSDGRTK